MKYLIIIVAILLSHEAVSQKYFLKVTNPDVDGSSTDVQHLDEIKLESFDFSVLNSVSVGSISAGGGAGKASSGPIKLKFRSVKGASKFFSSLHEGNQFEEFKISVQSTTAQSTFDYLVYTFKYVVVSNFSSEYLDAQDGLFYEIAVKVGTFKIEYYPTTANGTQDTANKKEATWSFILNNATENVQ